MKSSLQILAIVACVFSLAGNLQAQENSGMVAVLDVAKVFEDNTVFTSRMDAIKQEATSFKAQMEQEQAQIQMEAEPLKDLKPGSPEFNALQAALEQKTAGLRTKAQQTNTDLLSREARIYYDTYQQMQKTVAALATEYNISLIIRFDSQSIDPANRPDVIKGVNRNVVYQKNLDLTSLVISKMGSVSTADAGGNLNQ
ncbi:MAG: OmpH family outer membrane protein [Pirellulaceae bacterium]|nr:OmpH family outer membrane protein [Pirellulaceae bacterium]